MRKVFLLIISFLFLILFVLPTAQADLPPDPGGGGPTGPPVGGGSPIGSGLVILLTLGAAYGGSKTFQYKNHEKAN